MNKSQSILVTGATGFIGSHLVKRFIENGQNVHIIMRKTSQLSSLESVRDRINIHIHNGTTANMISILRKARPDCVIHLATLFLSNHKPNEITPLIQSNLLFGTQLLEAMSVTGAQNLINTGTTWQHYQNHSYQPVNLYSATKQAFLDLLAYYTSARQMNSITLELTDTYGPKDQRQKLFTLFTKISATGEILKMSPGEQKMDLLYIDDVVRAFEIAMTLFGSQPRGLNEIYQIRSKQKPSLKEVAQIYEKTSHVKLNIEWGGRPYREREVMNPWNQGKILPGWTPVIDLEEGIARMLAEK